MSSAQRAPESNEESRHENTDAADPRSTPAEESAEIDVRHCQAENRNGRQCGNKNVPGTFFCPEHLGDGTLPECDNCGHERLRADLDRTSDGLVCTDCQRGESA